MTAPVDERPRGLRCWLFRHPWHWSRNGTYLIRAISFKVCVKDGCSFAKSRRA